MQGPGVAAAGSERLLAESDADGEESGVAERPGTEPQFQVLPAGNTPPLPFHPGGGLGMRLPKTASRLDSPTSEPAIVFTMVEEDTGEARCVRARGGAVRCEGGPRAGGRREEIHPLRPALGAGGRC